MSLTFEVSVSKCGPKYITLKYYIHTLGSFIGNSFWNVLNVYDNNSAYILAQSGSHIYLRAQLKDHELLTHVEKGDVNTVPLCYSL